MSQTYSFGSSKFKTFVWLKGGGLFHNPNFLEVEFASAGAFCVEAVRADGSVACKASRSNEHGGWATFSFRVVGECHLVNGDYKFRFVNIGPGNQQIKSGRLEYDVS